MCEHCASLPVSTREVLAALYVAGASYAQNINSHPEQANLNLEYSLDQLLNGAPEGFIKVLVGCLVLMSLDELHPIYHQVMVARHAERN